MRGARCRLSMGTSSIASPDTRWADAIRGLSAVKSAMLTYGHKAVENTLPVFRRRAADPFGGGDQSRPRGRERTSQFAVLTWIKAKVRPAYIADTSDGQCGAAQRA